MINPVHKNERGEQSQPNHSLNISPLKIKNGRHTDTIEDMNWDTGIIIFLSFYDSRRGAAFIAPQSAGHWVGWTFK